MTEPDPLPTITPLLCMRTGREVFSGRVENAPPVTKRYHGGRMVEFDSDTIWITYDWVGGEWETTSVMVRGLIFHSDKTLSTRCAESYYRRAGISEAPDWIQATVRSRRPGPWRNEKEGDR